MEKASKGIDLSIIIPVYNGEKYIKNTISSLLNIKCLKEIIIINDCSTDKTLDILQEFKYKVEIINLNKNVGVSKARNIGIDASKGKYICFVDADDRFANDMHVKLLEKIKSSDSDICICNYSEIFEKNNKKINSKYDYTNIEKNNALHMYLIDKISPAIWDKIFKRDILNNIRFNEKLNIGEDLLFCVEIFCKAKKVSYINDYLYYYVQQDRSAMHTISNRLVQFKLVIDNIPDNIKEELSSNYKEEFDFFCLEMYTRGIHSITSITNKYNKKKSCKLLKNYYDKQVLKQILKNKYYGRLVKFEIFILKNFGIKIHLFFSPMYVKFRNLMRR